MKLGITAGTDRETWQKQLIFRNVVSQQDQACLSRLSRPNEYR
jgi:hypothetical protein